MDQAQNPAINCRSGRGKPTRDIKVLDVLAVKESGLIGIFTQAVAGLEENRIAAGPRTGLRAQSGHFRCNNTFAAVTNPPAIGAVGVSIAVDALTGKNPQQQTLLTPKVYATGDTEGLKALYAPDQQPGWSTYVNIPPYTHYKGSADVSACKGPGE